MKKRKLSKRLLSYILCLVMVISLVPMNALTVRAEGGSNTTFEYGDYKILMLSGYIDEGDGNFSCQVCGEPVFENYNPESDYADLFSIFGVGTYKCMDCGDGIHFGITMKTPLPNASPCPHCCKGKVCSKHANTHSYERYDIQSVCVHPCQIYSDNEEICHYHSSERLDITCEYCRGTGIDPYFTHDHHLVYVHKVDKEGINFHVSKCDYPRCDKGGVLPNSGYACDTDGPDGACSYCGFKAEAPAHTHTKGTYHEPVAATCTNPGVVGYWDCSCGEKLDANDKVISDVTIPATREHDYELKDGLLQCSYCGQIQAVAPSMMSYIPRSDIINSNNYIGDESEEDCSRDRTDKLKYKQIYYGKEGKKWYMLGIEDGALVLICDPSDNFGYTLYGSTQGDFDYPDSLLDEAMRKYYADTNHFSETEIGLMNEVSIYYPKAWNDPNGEQLSISRKMYAPSIKFTENTDPMSSKYIYAGKYEGSIKVRIDNKGIDTQEKYLYWTRTHSVEQSKNYLYVDSGNIDIWDLAMNDIVPIFHLNTSDILFASLAESAKANADFADAMTIRFDGTDKLTSSCTASSAQIIVDNPTEGEYLYVQWNDGIDKVKSFQPTTDKNVFTLEDGLPDDLRNCTIWLEKKVDNITYAVIDDHVHSKGTHHEAVEATCTKTGNVEYWECSGCDKNINDSLEEIGDITIPATGIHDFSTSPDKCSICGFYADLIGAKLAGYSLSLHDNIGVDFYMELADSVMKDEGAKFIFKLEGDSLAEIPVSEAQTTTVNGNTYYVFECRVAAAQMTGCISAKIVLGDGTEGTEYQFTVQDYAKYILEHEVEYEEVVPVVKAMLRYGASAQNYFGHNTDKMADEILSEADRTAALTTPELTTYNYSAPEATDTISFLGTSLLLESEVSLKCYFYTTVDLQDSNVIVKYGDKVLDTSDYRIGKNGNVQYVTVTGLTPADYGKQFTITVQDITVENVSAYGYMAQAFKQMGDSDKLTDLLKNMYAYGEAYKKCYTLL